MADELAMSSGALIFATLADVYLSSGMIDEAISILKDGLMRNPTYTLAKIILGRAYYMKGDIEEAIQVLEQAYEEAKDSEEENLYLGYCYRKRGEYDKALKFYEATLKINPEHEEAKKELETLEAEIASSSFPQEIVLEEEKAEAEVTPREQVAQVPVQPKEEVAIPLTEVKPEEIPPRGEAVQVREEVEPAQVTPEATIEEPKHEEAPEAMVVPEEQIERPQPQEILEPEERVVKPEESIGGRPQEQPAVLEREAPKPLGSLREPIERLLAIKNVKGAFLASRDGLLIQNYYEERTDIEEICALIAAVCNEADDSFKFLKAGNLKRCVIEKHDESLCVITAGESLLMVITEPEAKPGLIFVYARKIIEKIREILK